MLVAPCLSPRRVCMYADADVEKNQQLLLLRSNVCGERDTNERALLVGARTLCYTCIFGTMTNPGGGDI